jgi:hypothetical protein
VEPLKKLENTLVIRVSERPDFNTVARDIDIKSTQFLMSENRYLQKHQTLN